jgi:hypothetical protein
VRLRLFVTWLALALVAATAVAHDRYGRESRAFLVKEGSLDQACEPSTLSVWADDPEDRDSILAIVHCELPSVVVIAGDACARVSVSFFVQDEGQDGYAVKEHGRFSIDGHVHVQGYSCDTTTALDWFDEGDSRQSLTDRFATALCSLLAPQSEVRK